MYSEPKEPAHGDQSQETPTVFDLDKSMLELRRFCGVSWLVKTQ